MELLNQGWQELWNKHDRIKTQKNQMISIDSHIFILTFSKN